MSYTLPDYDPKTGSITFDTGIPWGGILKIRNESSYDLRITFSGSQKEDSVAPWSVDIYQLKVGQNSITLVPDLILVQNNPPSSVVHFTVYLPDEPVTGQYPASLTRNTNIGNTVSTSTPNTINISGETPPLQIILTTPAGYSSATISLVDTGSFLLEPLSNGVQVPALQVVAGNAITASTVQLDNNKISTNGSGILTALGFKGPVSAPVTLLLANGTLTIIDDGTNINHTINGFAAYPRTYRLFAWNASTGSILGIVIGADGSVTFGPSGSASISATGVTVLSGLTNNGNFVNTGTFSSDSGLITSNGTGTLTANTFAGQSTEINVSGAGGYIKPVWASAPRTASWNIGGFGGNVSQIITGYTYTGNVSNPGLTVNPDGSVAFGPTNKVTIDINGNIIANSITAPITQIVPANAKISIQQTAPTSPAKYDTWLQTGF